MPIQLPRLYLITDRHQTADDGDYLNRIESALAAGVRMLQMREKDLTANDLFILGQKLRQLTRRYDALLLINDRVDLALALDADGVHLPETSLPPAAARQLLGPQKIIGVSTHRESRIRQAAADGADFATFSPIYSTPSKISYGLPQGLASLGKACRATSLPIYALGGITADQVSECRQAGVFGVAVISGILAADDATTATKNFLGQF